MRCWPLASCSTLQPMNERVMTERTLTVSVPGGELIGVRYGSGLPLLVLHGGPAVNDYSDWFAAELAGWDALRYTQRGVVPSVTEGPFTIEQHVADALAVLDQSGVAAATVLGHSWGGYLAMQLAALAPGRVARWCSPTLSARWATAVLPVSGLSWRPGRRPKPWPGSRNWTSSAPPAGSRRPRRRWSISGWTGLAFSRFRLMRRRSRTRCG